MSIPELYKEKLFFKEITDTELVYLQKVGFSADKQKGYVAETGEENRKFLESHPMKEVVYRPQRGMADKKLFLPFFRVLPFICAGAACTILVGVFFFQPRNSNAIMQNLALAASGTERLKGVAEPRLFVYKKSADLEALLLRNESVVHENDVLQVGYISGGAEYGVIISVDGNGVLTQHFPDTGKTAGKLTDSGEAVLDYAYKLDDAPSFERFIFISADKAVSIDKLQKAFAAAHGADSLLTLNPALYLPEGCQVSEIVLLKDH